jgi:viroplasmin and RNaseH domain-containing protein
VVIAEHELWRQEGEEGVIVDTLDMCNQAVQGRKSAFRTFVSKNRANQWAEGDLKCKFDEVAVSAIYIALDEIITHDFST